MLHPLPHIALLSMVFAPLANAATNQLEAVPQVVPAHKYSHTLIASAELGEQNYPAFPILLQLGPTELLLGYKRGHAHYMDDGAGFDILRFNPLTAALNPARQSLRKADLIFQDGEFARFSNGDIACYIDVQTRTNQGNRVDVSRLGLLEFRSSDGGKTFKETGKLGLIDGVEYGYAFEARTEGPSTWMLVMTFSNLPGGRSISAKWPHAGSVDVIRSDDNGKTWHCVKNLTQEFGDHPINESSFVRHDKGFIVVARGYEDATWLQRTDDGFNVLRQSNLAAHYSCLRSYLGRPRVFERDGACYLMGRNYPECSRPGADPKASPMRLSLFRFNPDTLALETHLVLDNAEAGRVRDGYYAVPFWAERDRRTLFDVITYKALGNSPPDIVRFEYEWTEVR